MEPYKRFCNTCGYELADCECSDSKDPDLQEEDPDYVADDLAIYEDYWWDD